MGHCCTTLAAFGPGIVCPRLIPYAISAMKVHNKTREQATYSQFYAHYFYLIGPFGLLQLLFSYIFQEQLLFAAIILILLHVTGCEFIKCHEPRNLHEQLDTLYKNILNRNLLGSATFSVIPEYRRALSHSILNSAKKYKIYGISKCSKLKKRRHLRKHLNFKSTCPWYVYLDYDVNRIPQTMAKSECTCTECFNVHNSQMSGICEKINSYIPVIRRTCNGGIYKYSVVMETVPVGCTCKRNVIKRSYYMPT